MRPTQNPRTTMAGKPDGNRSNDANNPRPIFTQRPGEPTPLPTAPSAFLSVQVALTPAAPLYPPPEPFSPITLRIKTAVHVTADNNIVCLRKAPEEAAGEAARLVMEAMRAGSTGAGGVPMIDEEGRPRPVVVEVEAGWRVEGGGNVVGREEVVREVVRARLGI